MRGRWLISGALSAALTLVTTGAPVHAGNSDCFASQKLYSLRVQTEWSKKVYKVGEKAQVRVLVTRPGESDPSGNGLPMPSEVPPQPAEDIQVTSFVNNMFPLVGGYEYTDEDGVALIRFKVPKRARGWNDVVTRATTYHATGLPNDCLDVEEEGFRYDARAFKVE